MSEDQEQRSAMALAKGGELVPTTFDGLIRMSELYADSTFVPKDFQGKPGNVLVAVQFGAELGFKPMQALQSIAVVNGRPSIWGDALPAVCRRSPEWGGMKEEATDAEASCTVTRLERIGGKVVPTTITRTFSMEDAKRAGLAGKDTYKAYPRRMLAARARAFALRDLFPDVLKGIACAEEMQDVVDATVVNATTEPAPAAEPAKPKGAAGLKAKLGQKAQPAPAALPPEVLRFVAALDSAAFVDDVEAIKRDAAEVWGDLDPASREAIGEAGKRAVARIQGELKLPADPHAGIGSRFD